MLNPDTYPFPVLASFVEGRHVIAADYAENCLQGEILIDSSGERVNSH